MSDLQIDKSKMCLVVMFLPKGNQSLPTEPYDVKTVISNASELAEVVTVSHPIFAFLRLRNLLEYARIFFRRP